MSSLKRVLDGNGIQRMRAENVRGLPSAITDTGNGVTPIQQSYLYDADGDPVSITDAANAAQARSLTYDGQDRLATSVVGAQGSAPTGYRYDVLDNLTAVQRGTAVRTYGYDASNRLTQVNDPAAGNIALTWDARGNIATRGSQRYAFDGANRLQWVWGGESYRYDALGRRILAWSFADSQNILSMYSHAGTLVHQDNQREGGLQHDFIYLGNQLVAIVDTAPGGQRSVRYQHTDAQGTVAAQTDGNRVVLSRSVYADYGMAQDHANDDQPGYTGHLQDSLTGLTYMQQRYYDSTLQRFLSTDPVQTDPHTGASFNRYWYGNNNPYKFTDPDGRLTCKGTAADCKVVDQYVGKIKESKNSPNIKPQEARQIQKVITYLGKEGEGPTVTPTTLPGNTKASTNQHGEIKIDVNKNPHGADPLVHGAMALGHEAQHDITAKVDGEAHTREAATASERAAYGTEALIGRGLGVNLSPSAIDAAVKGSVENEFGPEPGKPDGTP